MRKLLEISGLVRHMEGPKSKAFYRGESNKIYFMTLKSHKHNQVHTHTQSKEIKATHCQLSNSSLLNERIINNQMCGKRKREASGQWSVK